MSTNLLCYGVPHKTPTLAPFFESSPSKMTGMPSVQDLVSYFSSSSYDTWQYDEETHEDDETDSVRYPVRHVRDGAYIPDNDSNDTPSRPQRGRLPQRPQSMEEDSHGNSLPSHDDDTQDQFTRIRRFFEKYDEETSISTHPSEATSSWQELSDRINHAHTQRIRSTTSEATTTSFGVGEVLDTSYDAQPPLHRGTALHHQPTIREDHLYADSDDTDSFPSRIVDQHPKISEAARKAREQLLRDFATPGRSHIPTVQASHNFDEDDDNDEDDNYDDDKEQDISTQPSTIEGDSSKDDSMQWSLHDLCSEAVSTEDVAWRNALYLLSLQPHLATLTDRGWTPLHVSCLGNSPPPPFWTRALLLVSPSCVRAVDNGGRLPLHMVAASSGDVQLLQLLVQEYPESVARPDHRGLTPLHMLLRNEHVVPTLQHVRILLGQAVPTLSSSSTRTPKRPLQRRGQHLRLTIDDLARISPKPPDDPDSALHFLDTTTTTTTLNNSNHHDLNAYPEDVQVCFRKLTSWKRKQRREEEGLEVELDDTTPVDERNPAAVATHAGMQLPLHIAVKRALENDTPVEDHDDDDDDDYDVENEHGGLPAPQMKMLEVLRVLIGAHPNGVLAQDFLGRTPLMTALLNEGRLPGLDLVELLLGMRSAGFESPPVWANDSLLLSLRNGKTRYANPAMVPAHATNQLPLHVAAEEMVSHTAVLASIHASYPGAVHVQDVRGRTPLHTALGNYQGTSLNPTVLSMLLTNRSVLMQDHDGKIPLTLLLEGAHQLPWRPPLGNQGRDAAVYKRFFQASLAEPTPTVHDDDDQTRFLKHLRRLPPWLRRHALGTTVVKELLQNDTVQSGKCAVVLLHGVVLVTLLILFRLQVTLATYQTDVGLAVTILAADLLAFHVCYYRVSATMGVFVRQCLLNPWAWVDFGAALLTILSNFRLSQGQHASEHATIATGLLWLSLIGFFARWWYGMAVFVGGMSRLFYTLLWPLLAVGALVMSFAQMFYTWHSMASSPEECLTVIGGRAMCNLRDAYTTVYLLALGTPLIDTDAVSRAETINNGTIVLIATFTVFMVVYLVNLVITVVVESARLDADDIAVENYWAPRLMFWAMVRDLTPTSWLPKRLRTSKGRVLRQPSWDQRLSAAMERNWDLLVVALMGGEPRRNGFWYRSCFQGHRNVLTVLCLRMMALVVMPLWLLVGLVTLGLLWPPQVRSWIFQTTAPTGTTEKPPELPSLLATSIRHDLMQLKALSFDRSKDLEREIRVLRELLESAIEEPDSQSM